MSYLVFVVLGVLAIVLTEYFSIFYFFFFFFVFIKFKIPISNHFLLKLNLF